MGGRRSRSAAGGLGSARRMLTNAQRLAAASIQTSAGWGRRGLRVRFPPFSRQFLHDTEGSLVLGLLNEAARHGTARHGSGFGGGSCFFLSIFWNSRRVFFSPERT